MSGKIHLLLAFALPIFGCSDKPAKVKYPAPVASIDAPPPARPKARPRPAVPPRPVDKENWYANRTMKVRLPAGRSAPPAFKFPVLALGQEGIFLGKRPAGVTIKSGVVDANAKRDGADGFFIDPLYRKLKTGYKWLVTERKRGRMLPFGLTIAADRKTSYRLVTEVLYTANQAGMMVYRFMVGRPDGKRGTVPLETPRILKTLVARAPFEPGLGKVDVISSATKRKAKRAVKEIRKTFKANRLKVVPGGSGFGLRGGGGYGFGRWKVGSKKAGRKKARKARPPLFTCNYSRSSRDKSEVPILVSVDGKGEVDRVAIKDATAAFAGCCIRPWIARLRFNRKRVPRGLYGFTLQVYTVKPGAPPPFPPASALRPVVRPVKKCGFGPLNLSLLITRKGYYLKSRNGSECPGKETKDRLCAEWKAAGRTRKATLVALSQHLHKLFTGKYAHPIHWRFDPIKRRSLTLIPMPKVPIEEIIEVMEAVRGTPSASKTCRLRLDAKNNRWLMPTAGATSCMYPFIVLALGAT